MSDHQSGIFVSTIPLTLSFYICLRFQKSKVHSVFRYNSGVQSFFHTNFQPSPLFSAKISNSASTAAQTTVSCLYSAHVRLPLQEPPGIGLANCLTLEGHLFLKQFLEPFFSHKNHILDQTLLKEWLIWRASENLFKKKCKNWKVCLDCIYVDGLHMSLSQRALNATKKSSKKLTYVKHMTFY